MGRSEGVVCSVGRWRAARKCAWHSTGSKPASRSRHSQGITTTILDHSYQNRCTPS